MKKRMISFVLSSVALIGGQQALTQEFFVDSVQIPSINSSQSRNLRNTNLVLENTMGTVQVSNTPESLLTQKDASIVTGIFGTVPWTLDKTTKTLTFGEGEIVNNSSSNNIKSNIGNVADIEKIVFTEPIILKGSASYLFANLNGVKTIEGADKIETSQVTDISYMFYKTQSLKSMDVSQWDTSNVTNMSKMFYYATSLKELNLSE